MSTKSTEPNPPQAEPNEIGPRLAYFRTDILKKSQGELAEETKTTQKTISFYETGRAIPSSRFVKTMSRLYGLHQDWLLSNVLPVQNKSRPNSSPKMNDDLLTRVSVVEAQLREIRSLLKTILNDNPDIKSPK